MSGRVLAWALAALAALAVAGQCVRWDRRLEADRIRHQVERHTVAAAERARPAFFWANVRLLERARRLDPADSRIQLALGGQYLLLGRPGEAAEVYRQALALEPRAEIYLNLGRAQAAAGDLEGAGESFRRAVVLDPRLRTAIPPELAPPRRRR